MKARYVNELAEGSRVDSVFVLRSKEMRTARTGEAYLALDVADRSGALPALYFRPSRLAIDIPSGSVVRVCGTITSFRGARRITVDEMTMAENWKPSDLMAEGSRPIEELVCEFKQLVKSVDNAGLRSLLRAVLADREFFKKFCECPGSQSYHHAHIGGLLEHTVSVASHCLAVSSSYGGVNVDLLIAAALLHDVGKVDELSWGPGVSYSDEGRFIGHVILGVQRVHCAGQKANLNADALVQVEHAILSHHGELEWGSPKRPSTVEALLLHHVDNLDAKTAGFAQALAAVTLTDEQWTDSANLFRRPLFAPRAAEDDRQRRPEEDGQHYQLSA